MNKLVLCCTASKIALLPNNGAAIQFWTWRGLDIFRPAAPDADVADMGCFPLVPFANRIGEGKLQEGVRLPPYKGERHSLHGIGWRRPWRILDASINHVQLELRHTLDAHWPFDFHATLGIELHEDRLEQVLTVQNTGTSLMPVGAGFHPYFAIDASTRLSTAWQKRWETSTDLLPVQASVVAPACEALVTDIVVNHCYTDWNHKAVLDFDDHRVTLTASAPCDYLQCYRPNADSPFIALEPVSHVPNAGQLYEAGQAVAGLAMLEAGATFTVSMCVGVEAR